MATENAYLTSLAGSTRGMIQQLSEGWHWIFRHCLGRVLEDYHWPLHGISHLKPGRYCCGSSCDIVCAWQAWVTMMIITTIAKACSFIQDLFCFDVSTILSPQWNAQENQNGHGVSRVIIYFGNFCVRDFGHGLCLLWGRTKVNECGLNIARQPHGRQWHPWVTWMTNRREENERVLTYKQVESDPMIKVRKRPALELCTGYDSTWGADKDE